MEEDEIIGNKILYIILQLCNFLIGLFGLTLLIIGIYLWINVKAFNSFILSFLLLFIILASIAALGCYTKSSVTILIIYFLLNMIITCIVLVFTFFLYVDQDKIVDYLTSKLQDSSKSDIKEKFERNLDSIKILFLSFIIVFVN